MQTMHPDFKKFFVDALPNLHNRTGSGAFTVVSYEEAKKIVIDCLKKRGPESANQLCKEVLGSIWSDQELAELSSRENFNEQFLRTAEIIPINVPSNHQFLSLFFGIKTALYNFVKDSQKIKSKNFSNIPLCWLKPEGLDLSGYQFCNSNLSGSDLSSVTGLKGTLFHNTNLKNVVLLFRGNETDLDPKNAKNTIFEHGNIVLLRKMQYIPASPAVALNFMFSRPVDITSSIISTNHGEASLSLVRGEGLIRERITIFLKNLLENQFRAGQLTERLDQSTDLMRGLILVIQYNGGLEGIRVALTQQEAYQELRTIELDIRHQMLGSLELRCDPRWLYEEHLYTGQNNRDFFLKALKYYSERRSVGGIPLNNQHHIVALKDFNNQMAHADLGDNIDLLVYAIKLLDFIMREAKHNDDNRSRSLWEKMFPKVSFERLVIIEPTGTLVDVLTFVVQYDDYKRSQGEEVRDIKNIKEIIVSIIMQMQLHYLTYEINDRENNFFEVHKKHLDQLFQSPEIVSSSVVTSSAQTAQTIISSSIVVQPATAQPSSATQSNASVARTASSAALQNAAAAGAVSLNLLNFWEKVGGVTDRALMAANQQKFIDPRLLPNVS